MVADKRKHLFLRTCFTALMLWATLRNDWKLMTGLTIVLFCISVIVFEVMGRMQSQPNTTTRPGKDQGLVTVFDYCPDCGAGDIVPDKDGKCTNCGYNLEKEVLENSSAVVACKESPESDMC